MTTTSFQPGQIVCLTCVNDTVYGEVIQVSETRVMCWMRPIVLWLDEPPPAQTATPLAPLGDGRIIDLRGGCDLLLPPDLLQYAGDVEFLSVLARLDRETKATDGVSSAKDDLRKFLQRVFCTVNDGERSLH